MPQKVIRFKVKAKSNLPNKMHLEVQQRTRANVFRDKTKYSRKRKYPQLEKF